MGKRATEYVESLVKTGDLLTLEFGTQRWDKCVRLLSCFYLSNGRMLFVSALSFELTSHTKI